jgi:hypothetical protein
VAGRAVKDPKFCERDSLVTPAHWAIYERYTFAEVKMYPTKNKMPRGRRDSGVTRRIAAKCGKCGKGDIVLGPHTWRIFQVCTDALLVWADVKCGIAHTSIRVAKVPLLEVHDAVSPLSHRS